jgi:hypothetical protein
MLKAGCFYEGYYKQKFNASQISPTKWGLIVRGILVVSSANLFHVESGILFGTAAAYSTPTRKSSW